MVGYVKRRISMANGCCGIIIILAVGFDEIKKEEKLREYETIRK